DGSLLPASEMAILQWIASLGPRVQPKTIKKYLTHVKSMHTDLNLSFTATDSPIIQRVIRGIKRFHGEKDRKPKQPITLPVLQDILAHLQPRIKPGHLVVYAACCIAFSGVSVRLAAAPGRPSCPIAALKALFPNGTTSDPTIPLFPSLDDQSKPISHTFFISAIREALSATGYDPSLFAGHSFRRGGASAAAAAGYSDHKIQMLGQWLSDTYKLYIEADPARILYISSSLHWAHSTSTSYVPPDL
ncbi:hypothetical protein IW261DRAFT_1344115, partial [Armillaria novae-zelandiae]